jgi:hypothetical protein
MFHPGYAPRISRAEQRERGRRQLLQENRKKKKHLSIGAPMTFSFFQKRWFILPQRMIPSFLQTKLMFLCANSVAAGIEALIKYGEPCELVPSYRLSVFELEYARILLLKNQAVRAAMSCLARLWLRRRMNQVNTEDPITFEIPEQPLVVLDWSTRSKYVFEAKSFFKYLLTQLTLQDSLFPIPTYPRNMYTNEIFTRGQLIAIAEQLRAFGLHHWLWDSFCELQFNLRKFKIIYDLPLKKYIIEKAFRESSSESTVEIILDFIEHEADFHNIVSGIPWRLLRWAFHAVQDHPYISKWRALCKIYYYQTTVEGVMPGVVAFKKKTKMLLEDKDAWVELNRLKTKSSQ